MLNSHFPASKPSVPALLGSADVTMLLVKNGTMGGMAFLNKPSSNYGLVTKNVSTMYIKKCTYYITTTYRMLVDTECAILLDTTFFFFRLPRPTSSSDTRSRTCWGRTTTHSRWVSRTEQRDYWIWQTSLFFLTTGFGKLHFFFKQLDFANICLKLINS